MVFSHGSAVLRKNQVAPRYVCSGVRVMVYFRLHALPSERPGQELAEGDGGETCGEVR